MKSHNSAMWDEFLFGVNYIIFILNKICLFLCI